MTRDLPTLARMSATAWAMKSFIVQSCRAPQTPTRKLRIMSTPRSVWNTSG
jgi:hypothetical protein